MNWCDPCAANPLSPEQLRDLGVFWMDDNPNIRNSGLATNVFISGIHVRYDAEDFPEDLIFQEAGDRSNFQGRYVLRQRWQGEVACYGAKDYEIQVRQRQEQEAKILASLTGWDIDDIKNKMGIFDLPIIDNPNWWQKLWMD